MTLKLEKTDFREITLQDSTLFNSYLKSTQQLSCEMNFANIFMWRNQVGNRFAELKERLLLVGVNEDILYFPLGEFFPPLELAEITANIKELGLGDGTIYDVPPEYPTQFPETNQFFTIEESLDSADYIYDLSALAELRGARLRKKRNLVKQFVANYPDIQLGEISIDNLEEFYALSNRLFELLPPSESLDHEKAMWSNVHDFLFAPELNMGSMTLSVNGEMIGFAIWSLIGDNCFDIQFEKIDHSIKGASQYMLQQLAIRLLGMGGKYMNREQDLGVEGLRHAKHSLDPIMLYKRLSLKLID